MHRGVFSASRSLAMPAAIRRASSLVSNFAAVSDGPARHSQLFRPHVLGDVVYEVLDNLIGCGGRWIEALVYDGTQLFRPFAGDVKRPRRSRTNSDEPLAVINAIDKNEQLRIIWKEADAEAACLIIPFQI
jgi:hypothetical protein